MSSKVARHKIVAPEFGTFFMMGDSLTAGARSVGNNVAGVRGKLWERAIEAGRSLPQYVGTLISPDPNVTYSGLQFNQHHEGHSGWRVKEVTDFCLGYDVATGLIYTESNDLIKRYQPTTICFWLGTNDIPSNDPPYIANRILEQLDRVVDAAVTAQRIFFFNVLPEQSPPNPSYYQPTVVAVNPLLLAGFSLRTDPRLRFFDAYSIINADLATYQDPDGTHLTIAGYDAIGNALWDRLVAA